MSATVKIIISAAVVVVVAIIVGLVASSLRSLKGNEVGFQYNVHQRTLKTEEVYTAGLHLGPPGYKFIKFPKVYQHVVFPSLKCLNKEGLDIVLSIEFQYIPSTKAKELTRLILDFRNMKKYSQVVKDTSLEVIHDICSEFSITDFQKYRIEFQAKVLTALDDRLWKDCLTTIRDVQVSNIKRPHAYEVVMHDKEAARQNIQVAYQERGRTLTAAQTKIRQAEAHANLTIIKAESDARISTMKALAQAKAIYTSYAIEAETYSQIILNQNLTISGLISYLQTRSIQSSKQPIFVNMKAPGSNQTIPT